MQMFTATIMIAINMKMAFIALCWESRRNNPRKSSKVILNEMGFFIPLHQIFNSTRNK